MRSRWRNRWRIDISRCYKVLNVLRRNDFSIYMYKAMTSRKMHLFISSGSIVERMGEY